MVIIEVQCEAQSDFISRMLYGVSKVVVEHLQAGESLSELSLSQEEHMAYERYVDNARNVHSTIETAYEEGDFEFQDILYPSLDRFSSSSSHRR